MPDALAALLDRWLARLHIPSVIRGVLIHVVLVFAAAFLGQITVPAVISALGAGHVNWPALASLATSAVVAGGSAVGHYLVGLVPARVLPTTAAIAAAPTESTKNSAGSPNSR